MSNSERVGSRRRRPATVPRKKSRRPLIVVLSAIAAVAALIVVLVIVLAPPTTPSFQNETGAQASTAANAASLHLTTIQNPDGKACQAGHKPAVISQYPSPGTGMPPNKTVSVVYDCHE